MELVHVKTHEQKNTVHHECSKHIDTRFHFIREHIKEGDVELVNVKIMNKLLTFLQSHGRLMLFVICRKSLIL
jgi:hypothetical protein